MKRLTLEIDEDLADQIMNASLKWHVENPMEEATFAEREAIAYTYYFYSGKKICPECGVDVTYNQHKMDCGSKEWFDKYEY